MNTDTKARGVPSTKANNEGEQKGEQKNQKKREKSEGRKEKTGGNEKKKKNLNNNKNSIRNPTSLWVTFSSFARSVVRLRHRQTSRERLR